MPSKQAWEIWRRFLKSTILGRGMNLRKSLGQWIREDYNIWQWYYSPSLDSLIHITESGELFLHARLIPNINNHVFSPTRAPIKTLPTPLLKASIQHSKRNCLWLIDTGTFIDRSPTNTHRNFFNFVRETHRHNFWCFENVFLPSRYGSLLNDMRTGQVLIISDGSYNPTSQRGTAAWILESSNSSLHIIGKIWTPGVKTVLSAYRCELAGILSAITVLNSLA
jgi:hypothetical protein